MTNRDCSWMLFCALFASTLAADHAPTTPEEIWKRRLPDGAVLKLERRGSEGRCDFLVLLDRPGKREAEQVLWWVVPERARVPVRVLEGFIEGDSCIFAYHQDRKLHAVVLDRTEGAWQRRKSTNPGTVDFTLPSDIQSLRVVGVGAEWARVQVEFNDGSTGVFDLRADAKGELRWVLIY